MKVACLTRYGPLGASSRVRFMQYKEPLREIAPRLHLTLQSLLDDDYLQRKYARRSTFAATLRCYGHRFTSPELLHRADLWWIEKELWPYVPASLERVLLGRAPYVLDLDDAIFHNYDLHPSTLVRRLLGRKIDRLMTGAALVTAGNSYIAQRARSAGARWVEVLPTVIDLFRYPKRVPSAPVTLADNSAPLTIGWIGSPATSRYLARISEPLARLANRRRIRLCLIGTDPLAIPGVEVVSLPWSEATEVEGILDFDIGVMPLADSPWERGKCGYKLIQYMACGLPVVASPVGVNTTLVEPGVNGFLARDAAGWYEALVRLADDAPLRRRMGAAGRERVEKEYCLQVTAPRLAQWLLAAAAKGSR